MPGTGKNRNAEAKKDLSLICWALKTINKETSNKECEEEKKNNEKEHDCGATLLSSKKPPLVC